MDINLKCLRFRRQNSLIIIIIAGILFGISPFLKAGAPQAQTDLVETPTEKLAIIEENSLLPIAGLSNPIFSPIQKMDMVVTGYSSTEDQTDPDPFITASGTMVRDGVVATNILPFGTKIQLPELYGDKIFVVEDRMSWEKGYHIDIWFSSREEALEFGAKRTYIEILEG